MSAELVQHILQPNEGEAVRLKLREIILKVDPQRTHSPFAMGVDTLQPGGEIPPHRLLHYDQVFFAHKGQGRATIDGRAVALLPGMVVSVPRQTWHAIKNTGTGALRIAWVAWPAGLEAYYRERAKLDEAPDAATLTALDQRYGIEWRVSEGAVATPAVPAPAGAGRRHGRRRHRGGRGRRRPQPPPQTPPVARNQAGHAASAPVPRSAAQQIPPVARGQAGQAPAARPSAASPAAKAARRHQRYGKRVKEVYMGGRWVKVAGEGPVVAGEEDPTK